MSEYFPKQNSLRANVCNYATRSVLINPTGVDTSSFTNKKLIWWA